MTECEPITNIKLTPYLVAIRVIERKLFGIDTVFYDFKIAVAKIITTSKLVVCTAPIRGAYWLSP